MPSPAAQSPAYELGVCPRSLVSEVAQRASKLHAALHPRSGRVSAAASTRERQDAAVVSELRKLRPLIEKRRDYLEQQLSLATAKSEEEDVAMQDNFDFDDVGGLDFDAAGPDGLFNFDEALGTDDMFGGAEGGLDEGMMDLSGSAFDAPNPNSNSQRNNSSSRHGPSSSGSSLRRNAYAAADDDASSEAALSSPGCFSAPPTHAGPQPVSRKKRVPNAKGKGSKGSKTSACSSKASASAASGSNKRGAPAKIAIRLRFRLSGQLVARAAATLAADSPLAATLAPRQATLAPRQARPATRQKRGAPTSFLAQSSSSPKLTGLVSSGPSAPSDGVGLAPPGDASSVDLSVAPARGAPGSGGSGASDGASNHRAGQREKHAASAVVHSKGGATQQQQQQKLPSGSNAFPAAGGGSHHGGGPSFVGGPSTTSSQRGKHSRFRLEAATTSTSQNDNGATTTTTTTSHVATSRGRNNNNTSSANPGGGKSPHAFSARHHAAAPTVSLRREFEDDGPLARTIEEGATTTGLWRWLDHFRFSDTVPVSALTDAARRHDAVFEDESLFLGSPLLASFLVADDASDDDASDDEDDEDQDEEYNDDRVGIIRPRKKKHDDDLVGGGGHGGKRRASSSRDVEDLEKAKRLGDVEDDDAATSGASAVIRQRARHGGKGAAATSSFSASSKLAASSSSKSARAALGQGMTQYTSLPPSGDVKHTPQKRQRVQSDSLTQRLVAALLPPTDVLTARRRRTRPSFAAASSSAGYAGGLRGGRPLPPDAMVSRHHHHAGAGPVGAPLSSSSSSSSKHASVATRDCDSDDRLSSWPSTSWSAYPPPAIAPRDRDEVYDRCLADACAEAGLVNTPGDLLAAWKERRRDSPVDVKLRRLAAKLRYRQRKNAAAALDLAATVLADRERSAAQKCARARLDASWRRLAKKQAEAIKRKKQEAKAAQRNNNKVCLPW